MRGKAIEEMLGEFLKNKTVQCVEAFVKANYSIHASAEVKKMEIDLDVLDEGIKIEATVPLKIGTRETFTQSSEFDLFYPTYFKRFLDTSISRPLGFDVSYLDFNYTPKNLKQDKFKHKCYGQTGKIKECIKSLNQPVGFTVKTEVKKDALANGDDIYQFTASGILKNQEYLFQFARQNRPPALDYVSRNSCLKEGYDYLVIPGAKDQDMGLINISLFAMDPDEENVSYGFFSMLKPLDFDSAGEEYDTNRFVVNGSLVTPDWYNVSAVAKDKFGKQDNQTVRVLVDRPIKVSVNVTLPYKEVNNELSPGVFVISREDPFFVKVDLPSKSLIEKTNPSIVFSYESLSNSWDSFQYKYSQPGANPCFNFPGLFKYSNCALSDYSLQNWEVLVKSPFYNITKSSKGKIKIDYGLSYCDQNKQESSSEVTVQVVACIPYEQKGYPYPYMEGTTYYQKKKGDTDPYGNVGYIEDNDLNPFFANHSCCEGDINKPKSTIWEPKKKGTVCFDGPEQTKCVGKDPFPQKFKMVGTCDGKRGNVCGEPELKPLSKSKVCGNPGKCDVDVGCKEPYSKTTGGWCNFNQGCKIGCTSEIVDTGSFGFSPDALKKYGAKEQYVCGCDTKVNGKHVYAKKPCWSLQKKGQGTCEDVGFGNAKYGCVIP